MVWAAFPVSAVLVAAGSFSQTAHAQTIVPHRAAYTATLAPAYAGGQIGSVSGDMLFEWLDVCEGWTLSQTYQLSLSFAGGSSAALTSRYTTFESYDGQRFTFDAQDTRNGVAESESRGDATLDASPGPGVAQMRLPAPQEMALPDETWFPTAHSVEILRRAADGERIFSALMFDGSATLPLTLITTVIGQPRAPAAGGDEAPVSDAQPGDAVLRAGTSWPVVLAYFDPASQDAEPIYEVRFTLYDTGFIDAMTVDYGDFGITLSAVAAEALPTNC